MMVRLRSVGAVGDRRHMRVMIACQDGTMLLNKDIELLEKERRCFKSLPSAPSTILVASSLCQEKLIDSLERVDNSSEEIEEIVFENVDRSVELNLSEPITVTYIVSLFSNATEQMASAVRPNISSNVNSNVSSNASSTNSRASSSSSSHYLVNVHEALRDGNANAVVVSGTYRFYHYGHDGEHDDGYGCAYRSLQTLCSWRDADSVPSIRRIQTMLVELGDKPASIVGSRQWIGAFEVMLCLQHLFHVESAIVNVRSGADVVRHVDTFARHFERVGSPIMIGGGVLAWTLLGVAVDKRPEQTRFLILDPHYRGVDDTQRIVDQRACAWQPLSIFQAKHFYNFCLPQFQ
jgi:Peptidase family C78